MRDGLQPSELMYDDSQVVSLSDTVQFALDCASQTQQVPPEDLVVLEITTRGQDQDYSDHLHNTRKRAQGWIA